MVKVIFNDPSSCTMHGSTMFNWFETGLTWLYLDPSRQPRGDQTTADTAWKNLRTRATVTEEPLMA